MVGPLSRRIKRLSFSPPPPHGLLVLQGGARQIFPPTPSIIRSRKSKEVCLMNFQLFFLLSGQEVMSRAIDTIFWFQ
jgi:hypothetical protein